MKTKVFLVDDHAMIREGLKLLINREDTMCVVGEAKNGRDTLRRLNKVNPEIVIMDVEMPDMNGIEATRTIVRQNQTISVIALSAHTDSIYISEMLKAGAKGYLLKHSASDELVNAIRAVQNRRTYLCPEVAETVTSLYRRETVPKSSLFGKLSSREREVLQMIAEGKSRKEIASALYVSVKTISTHVEHIETKLELHGIAELTKYAIRHGLTSVE